jgi:hypothetical protein
MPFQMTSEQRKRGARNALFGHRHGEGGRNKLAAMRDATVAPEEPKKAYEECQCKPFVAGGKRYMLGQSDCKIHGIFNQENPAFAQQPERAPTHTRKHKVNGSNGTL